LASKERKRRKKPSHYCPHDDRETSGEKKARDEKILVTKKGDLYYF